MSVNRSAQCTTVWGSWDDEGCIAPEPAIMITRYQGCVGLAQEDRELVIAYRDVPELLKELRRSHKEGEPE